MTVHSNFPNDHSMSPYEFIRQLLVKEFAVPADRITLEATLDSLGLDSLALAELVLELETEYDIVLSEDQAKFRTLGEAAELVDALVRRAPLE